MSIILVFLVVAIGFAGWWLAHQRLLSKPWLEVGPDPVGGPGRTGLPPQKIGLGIFLAVVGALFALLASAYFMRMEFADWRPMPLPRIIWLNTAMLIVASAALECGLAANRQRDRGTLHLALVTAVVATLTFLAGQLVAWRDLVASGYLVAGNPANSFFYLLTGLHGLHIIGGLVALGRVNSRSLGRRGPGEAPAPAPTLRRLLALPALRLAVLAHPLHRRGKRPRQHLPQRPQLREPSMAETTHPSPPAGPRLQGWRGIVADWSSDQRAFKQVSWKKAMMWIFLLSDTFIFSCFLIAYMTARSSTTVPWPNPSEVFALHMFGQDIPLILIAIMTFVLISSSGTMALAVNFGYRRDRVTTAWLMLATAALGATFVGMQAFEWTKLIHEGVRPWGNPWGAEQFGATFFMITGFHGTHVTIGVIFLLIIARKVLRGDFDAGRPGYFTSRRGAYENVEVMGLYWHFVDLVWVFIFAFFYLW